MHDASPSRFQVSESEQSGQRLVALADDEAETQAILVPGLGFACIAFHVATGSSIWSVLSEPPDHEALLTRTTRYGIPILFPWPNRIRDGRFTFDSREYRMPLAPTVPHASHGLVRDRPWTVEEASVDARGAFCRASIALGDSPADAWPFPCRLTVEYRLNGRTLSLLAETVNLGTSTMPMGFGIHPWFNVPFGPSGARSDVELSVPADAFWALDDSFCTTGEIRPVSDGFDARAGRPLGHRFVDDVYTGLALDGGWFTAEVRDPANGRSIAVRSDTSFREHVVYAPLNRSVICLEPYTCATDAFNLAARGLDAGMILLEPGRSWRGALEIRARP